MNPRRVGERRPKVCSNSFMETRAPIEPVSYPLRKPPRATAREERMYGGIPAVCIMICGWMVKVARSD